MPLSREEFIQRATEIAGHAPEGLSREQFEEFILKAIEPKIRPDQRSIGDRALDWLSEQGPVPGVIAGAARNAAGDFIAAGDMLVPDSIKKPTVVREPSGPNETLGAKAWTVGEIALGAKGAGEILGAAPGLARRGLYSLLSHPAVEAVTGSIKAVRPGENVGMLARVRDYLMDTLKPNVSANAGGTLSAPGMQRTIEDELRSRLDDIFSQRQAPAPINEGRAMQETTARLDDMAASPARAGATTDFVRTPNSNVGGRLVPGSRVTSVEDEIRQALEEATVSDKPMLVSKPVTNEGLPATADSAETIARQAAQGQRPPLPDFAPVGGEAAFNRSALGAIAEAGEADPFQAVLRNLRQDADLTRASRVGVESDMPANVTRIRSIADEADTTGRAAHEAGAAQRKGAKVKGPGVVDAYARAGDLRKMAEMRASLERMMKRGMR